MQPGLDHPRTEPHLLGVGIDEDTCAMFDSDGNIKVIWLSTDPSGGTNLPDGTTLYTLCFTAIGDLPISRGMGRNLFTAVSGSLMSRL